MPVARPWQERLLEKVQRGPGCWLWQAAKVKGYGVLHVNGRLEYAHRLMYQLYVGPIPAGKELDHLCRTSACACPWHVEPVTHLENIARGEMRARQRLTAGNHWKSKTHCPQGHPYDAANTYSQTPGGRACRTCRRARRRKPIPV